MISGKKYQSENSTSNFSADFYNKADELIKNSEFSDMFGKFITAYEKDGVIHIDFSNGGLRTTAKTCYGEQILSAAREMGFEKIVYGIKPKREEDESIFIDDNLSYSSDNYGNEQIFFGYDDDDAISKLDLEEQFRLYSAINNVDYSKFEKILHKGNEEMYRAFDYTLESLLAGKSQEKPLLVQGKGGLGKTFGLGYLEYWARQNGALVVYYNVDGIVRFLSPENRKIKDLSEYKKRGIAKEEIVAIESSQGEKYIPDPHWVDLALDKTKLFKDRPILLAIDHLHEAYNWGSDIQRAGTLNLLYRLYEGLIGRAHLVFSFTESPKEAVNFDRFVEKVGSDKPDYWGRMGKYDFARRIAGCTPIDVEKISTSEIGDVIGKIASRNKVLTQRGVNPEIIVEGIDAANFGIQRGYLFSEANDTVKNIEVFSNMGNVINQEFIVKKFGKKKANKRLAEGGFDFQKRSYIEKSVAEISIPINHTTQEIKKSEVEVISNYDPEDIMSAITDHTVLNRIPLKDEDSVNIKEVNRKWPFDENNNLLELKSLSDAEVVSIGNLMIEVKKYAGPKN
ncbi:MAG: hypothetical protein OQK82_06265 [Candidatus Pacearchaeota archaeon]|nr:hypothetical protein [Candidatus Pacearchaeota archaeon]